MTLQDIAQMFNRSLAHAFRWKKFVGFALLLILAGLLYLLFESVAGYAPYWLGLPLKFVPLFVGVGLIMAAGTLLVRLYIKEQEKETSTFMQVVWDSLSLLVKAACLSFPLLFAFGAFWVVLAVLLLLRAIPYFGNALGVVLAFLAFALNFGTVLLFIAALLAFFFLVPSLAVTEKLECKSVLKPLKENLFSALLLLAVACIPFWIVWKIVGLAAVLTLQAFAFGDSVIEVLLQSFFMLLPIAALLTPALTFFFNFAYESYKALTED